MNTDDFTAKPYVANMFGLFQAEANPVVPQKRMSPTLVEKDGDLFMAVGIPEETTIINSVGTADQLKCCRIQYRNAESR